MPVNLLADRACAKRRVGGAAVVFGHHFISNPDLPARVRVGVPLVEPDSKTFYSPGPRGYTDYQLMGAA